MEAVDAEEAFLNFRAAYVEGIACLLAAISPLNAGLLAGSAVDLWLGLAFLGQGVAGCSDRYGR